MTRSSICKLLLASVTVALGIKTWRAANTAGPQIVTTSSLFRHEQLGTQSNQTPTNPDVETRLDIHFSSRGRPAPPRYTQ
ncbi:MAG: hypothetical protein WBP22_03550 [Candidatus Saccharimonas sp.]